MKINFYSIKQTPVFKGKTTSTNVSLPSNGRNYTLFDEKHVNEIVSQREKALPKLKETLKTSTDEKEIVETLYIIDRMADADVKGLSELYPYLAKFNNTQSANIQVFLAGIYRKTQVPDAFGPLCAMLIRNSIESTKNSTPSMQQKSFDANEEIGGAILSYIKNDGNKTQK